MPTIIRVPTLIWKSRANSITMFTFIKVETHLLLNVPVNQEDEIPVSNLERGFTLQNEVMQGE